MGVKGATVMLFSYVQFRRRPIITESMEKHNRLPGSKIFRNSCSTGVNVNVTERPTRLSTVIFFYSAFGVRKLLSSRPFAPSILLATYECLVLKWGY